MNRKNRLCLLLASVCLTGMVPSAVSSHAQGTRPFTVADDIGITQEGDIWTGSDIEPKWSPDSRFVALHLTSASLEDGLLHDRIVVYAAAALKRFSASGLNDKEPSPKPSWEFEVTAPPNDWGDPATENLSWMDDNSGIAFLRWTKQGTRQLCFAEIARKQISPLTPADQNVMSFSIRDQHHFVYTVPSSRYIQRQTRLIREPVRVVTGEKIASVLYPERYLKESGRGDLWAGDEKGLTHPVIDPSTQEPIFLYGRGISSLSLSNDGASLVAILPMDGVTAGWVRDYNPPYPESPIHLREGPQDLDAPFGNNYVGRYAQVSLRTGSVTFLADTPDVVTAGWLEGAFASAVWSADDRYVFVPGLFVTNVNAHPLQRPCYSVVTLASREATCVTPMHGATLSGREAGYNRLLSARFAGVEGRQINLVTSSQVETFSLGEQGWTSKGSIAPELRQVGARIVASPTSPPKFVVTETSTSKERTVLDLNPQLEDVSMADVRPFHWTDDLHHEWQGLLYLPIDYKKGRRYPLVIQNHGVMKDAFAPSGEFPSAFAAQEFASTGIMVLQVQDCPGRGTPAEVECNVLAYDAAVAQLSREGRVDPERVGLIGFSRTVAYVMSSLVNGKVHYRAASITDGFNVSLMTYALVVSSDRFIADEVAGLAGAQPQGPGLLRWLGNSPDLRIEEIQTPLRVATKKDLDVLPMWEPYAFLKAAGKPTEIVVLNTSEHVINDPRVRFAAQEGTLEWFRFWLQGWEDPSPLKADQYRRWREMRSQPTL